ncbi:hypothetical protein GF325_15750, partial [Candidatus Bathyarchaeota archaeon]|nr:hypothetical protein [Candidatus Bathyarchaeota archaeon]
MLLQITLDINITLGIVLAIIGSVCLNLGKGVQRIGAETLGKEMLKKWKTNPEDKKKIILWLVGTAMTALSMVFSMAAAFFLDRPSTAVALSGVGILSVVLFSFYVIKEKVSGLQILAIILIILGT